MYFAFSYPMIYKDEERTFRRILSEAELAMVARKKLWRIDPAKFTKQDKGKDSYLRARIHPRSSMQQEEISIFIEQRRVVLRMIADFGIEYSFDVIKDDVDALKEAYGKIVGDKNIACTYVCSVQKVYLPNEEAHRNLLTKLMPEIDKTLGQFNCATGSQYDVHSGILEFSLQGEPGNGCMVSIQSIGPGRIGIFYKFISDHALESSADFNSQTLIDDLLVGQSILERLVEGVPILKQ